MFSGVGPIRLLEAVWNRIRTVGDEVRLPPASSAEIFGDAAEYPQT